MDMKCEKSDKCENQSTAPHECPYQAEINDDKTTCTCCEPCEQQCRDDI